MPDAPSAVFRTAVFAQSVIAPPCFACAFRTVCLSAVTDAGVGMCGAVILTAVRHNLPARPPRDRARATHPLCNRCAMRGPPHGHELCEVPSGSQVPPSDLRRGTTTC